MNLDGKIALVTGASRGIGKETAIKLSELGATVVGTATSDVGAQKITDYFKASNLDGMGVKLNLIDPSGIDEVLAQMKNTCGLPDILVNNAGITRDNIMIRMTDEQWDEVIQTNLSAIFKLSKACLRSMMKKKWGRIVSIGSVVGLSGNPGQANYCAAKAGLIGFSKSLAIEVASRGITVNVVTPGFIQTDMTDVLSDDQQAAIINKIPSKKMGLPSDIASAVTFLASGDAGYITGNTLNVNGGMYMQ